MNTHTHTYRQPTTAMLAMRLSAVVPKCNYNATYDGYDFFFFFLFFLPADLIKRKEDGSVTFKIQPNCLFAIGHVAGLNQLDEPHPATARLAVQWGSPKRFFSFDLILVTYK